MHNCAMHDSNFRYFWNHRILLNPTSRLRNSGRREGERPGTSRWPPREKVRMPPHPPSLSSPRARSDCERDRQRRSRAWRRCGRSSWPALAGRGRDKECRLRSAEPRRSRRPLPPPLTALSSLGGRGREQECRARSQDLRRASLPRPPHLPALPPLGSDRERDRRPRSTERRRGDWVRECRPRSREPRRRSCLAQPSPLPSLPILDSSDRDRERQPRSTEPRRRDLPRPPALPPPPPLGPGCDRKRECRPRPAEPRRGGLERPPPWPAPAPCTSDCDRERERRVCGRKPEGRPRLVGQRRMGGATWPSPL